MKHWDNENNNAKTEPKESIYNSKYISPQKSRLIKSGGGGGL